MSGGRTALVDADPLVYRAAFAAQSVKLWAVIVHNETNEVQTIEKDCTSLKSDDCQYAPPAGWSILEVSREVVPQSDAFLGQVVEGMLTSIRGHVDADCFTLYLSAADSSSNFRNEIATIAPYKGNRSGKDRPHHYNTARRLLLSRYDAQLVSHVREADDQIAIEARKLREAKKPYTVVSIDKDLDQISGAHYDFLKKVSYTVSPDDARAMFWKQVLSGDPVDNVPGACRIGAVTAAALVSDWMEEGLTTDQMFDRAVDVYIGGYNSKRCPDTTPENWTIDTDIRAAEAAVMETAKLVYLQQRPCELWAPPQRGGIKQVLNCE